MEYSKQAQFQAGIVSCPPGNVGVIAVGRQTRPEAVRVTAAFEVCEMATNKVVQLEKAVVLLENKLATVMRDSDPSPIEKDEALRDIPPLFRELRGQVLSVCSLAERLESIIERLEV